MNLGDLTISSVDNRIRNCRIRNFSYIDNIDAINIAFIIICQHLLSFTDMGQDTAMYYVYVDQVRLSEGTDDVICALQDLLCIHFVHNFKYIKPASKFLELMQQYLLKIIPSSGSKSNAYRVGNQQRVVQKVIDHLSSHEF